MARARNIKPGFFRNADLVELSMEARLLFIGLWTLADRAGRLEDRPKQIKMDVFPADSVDCDALLNQLAATGMVVRYEVNGVRYLQVVNFAKHQNPHRDEKASTLPDRDGNVADSEPVAHKHRANTVQTPCKADATTVAIGLIPDPLIPDPLIPDPLTKKGEEEAPDGAPPPSMTGAICVALKAVGLASVNPSHPDLQVLIDKGADIGVFVEAARQAVAKQKPFSYVLAMVKGRMADAAALATTALAAPGQTGPPILNKQQALEASNNAIAAKFIKDMNYAPQ